MKIGFIGLGNMANAMIGGIIKKGIFKAEEIIGSDPLEEGLIRVREKFPIVTTLSNQEVAEKSEILVLSIKPQFYQSVIEEIRDCVSKDIIVISIAPGKTLDWLGNVFQKQIKIVRCMPNTPALVGEGCTGVCYNEGLMEAEIQNVLTILSGFGKALVVAEHMMDAVVGVSGSSPAYVFMFIEAMADAAVAEGLPRKQAYEFAAQSVLGSAKMVLEMGKHPAELKDMVCSPGGTTIQAVRVLEERGLRSAVIEAIEACVSKARTM